MSHVELKNVSKTFNLRSGGANIKTRALDNLSLNIERGEIVALTGPSGCGKTTALRIIMGLEEASGGMIRVAGKEINGCGLDRGMVFQHAELLPWRSAVDNIRFALEANGVAASEIAERAERFIDLVGLRHAMHHRPHQLSGGMKQRVGIARALAIDPEVLLMDEPFGALDSQTREVLQMELLDIHQRTGKTIIFVTHDLDEAVLLADRIAVMVKGRLREIIDVNIERPRNDMRAIRGSEEFARKRHLAWDALHSHPEDAVAAHGSETSDTTPLRATA
ncbi:ABC transporter ATP-binding protein [Paracoccus onubensis]|uniref:ABC transporter ATP-binding protein n=1 Tax=Paracoccus onubensis TaxID=1675788 RepID=UPI002730B1A0|nr:ABC transporter ATP-binding protein [Paracoccus onubensis]MDP0926614.1 ABC transporter ATP-binding protein [Paracoccus onubensis]